MIKIGSKWFKCDLHLHTTASKCFKDRNVTAEDWVTECIEKKLDCVAVTDHNTAEGIAEVQEEAKKKGLYVFPGVEITCDTSKVHMLILFDIDTSYKIIEDFLSACDIDRNKFGQQDAFTTKSIIEVAKKAKERGALIIPAHIDEYNGLGKMGDGPLGMLLDLENINAVQVVHEQFYQNSKLLENPKRIEEVSTYLSKYYPSINSKDRVISKDMIKDWYRPVKKAIEKNLSIVTFSDNPHGERNSSHGTWGIGKRYTWIKMDIQPSLEGLRQAFLMPKFRIKNDFEYKDNPNQKPKMFINSLTLIDTELNRIDEFVIDFHHQLNTIIGTPGSGKSSILKCIRGILKNTKDLEGLDSIFHDHHNFYKVKDKNAKGIFTKNSILKLSINKDNVEYEIVVKEIQDTDRQNVEIYKMENGIREIQPEETLSFFNTEHYSQKQIFEIAQEPNSLRERIDNAIDEMKDKKIVLRSLEGSFLTKCNEIKEIEIKVDRKGFLEAEINDINNQISVFNKSGIQHLLKESKNYETQLLYVTNIENFITDKIKNFDDCIRLVSL
jgi:PHP family Zn ribbon phosphoesterase